MRAFAARVSKGFVAHLHELVIALSVEAPHLNMPLILFALGALLIVIAIQIAVSGPAGAAAAGAAVAHEIEEGLA